MLGEKLEHLVDVGHIEVSAQTEVLGSPVVSTQKGVNKRQSTLACSGVSQVSHIEFARHLLCYPTEYLGDGILALGFLAKHIFCAWLLVHADGGDTSTLLSAVVLLLHHQIELVESVSPRAVLLLVIVQRLQQTNHRHAAFVLQLFHN